MVMDSMGPAFNWNPTCHEQSPNPEAQKFFDLLKDADEPLWDGCKTHTKLSAVSQLLNLKSEYNMPEACYDRLMLIIKSMLPEGEKLPDNLYKTKRQLGNLGLGYQKIDACANNCMLYYKEHKYLKECHICGHPRYKTGKPGARKKMPYKILRYLPLIPRLQRLYASKFTCEHMTWHAKNQYENGSMAHPAHGEAWKHFDRTHPSFASEARNVRLGLCTDGFSPFGNSSIPYSCWPVIITVYNLPPWMCMNKSFMFLNMVIPGPKSPGKDIDVFLRPLIDELKMLWNAGVETYDVCSKQNFQMRASLMWTISDFPANAMLSGWSTHGWLACPYCMENTKSFKLQFGRKASWFDCHRQFLPSEHPYRKQAYKFRKGRIEKDPPPPRLGGEEMRKRVDMLPDITFGHFSGNVQEIEGFGKRHNWVKKSIFWELPYWYTNLIRHNLDIMHIEKNVFDNIFNTIMDVKDKTKDNVKARKDLEKYCSRPELNLIEGANGKVYKPKASYSLSKAQIKEVCSWAKSLKFPDGYSSNIARCVNENESKFYGMKSHDCHVFMQRLLPIAFRDLLPTPIWETLTELSNFFRDICRTVLHHEHMQQLEKNIAVILCKLEKIFPPGFFNSMEHLPIHLAYEAKVGGPVQYRWMYPFERFLYHLKKKVGNRARVEASIVEAYMIEEVSTFCSSYFEPHVRTRLNQVPRNDDGGVVDLHGHLSICTHPGRTLGSRVTVRYLSEDELRVAHCYILMNCVEIGPFLKKFDEEKRSEFSMISEKELDTLRDRNFSKWLLAHVQNRHEKIDSNIIKLAHGPNRRVSCYKGYFVNGFKFHTMEHGYSKTTTNYGVCVLGNTYNEYGVDYYGLLEEILELEYYGLGSVITLFKCLWFDTSHKGIKVHRVGLVEINNKSKLNTYDPFILASQAHQVYYTSFPSMRRDRRDWWAACKVKPRGKFDIPSVELEEDNMQPRVENAFQEGEAPASQLFFVGVDDDGVDIVVGDVEELNPNEMEELHRYMNLSPKAANNEDQQDEAENEEEFVDFDSEKSQQDADDYDSNSSDSDKSLYD